MTNINGYDLSRAWFDWCFENPEKISPNHTALYFFIIEHCNRLGWKKKFGLPTQMAMEAIGIKNWRTYKKTFDDLIDFGFIELLEKSKNQYSANIVAIVNNAKAPTKAPTKALTKAMQKHIQKQGQKQYKSIVGIDKPLTLEPITNNHQSEIEELDPEIISILSFDEFWNLYDYKKGKPKAEKLYAKISEKDRAKIKEHIPKYVLATPDKKFRKHPETFLRNRGWEDEIINRNGNTEDRQTDKDAARRTWLAQQAADAFGQ